MPARHRHHHSSEWPKTFTMTLESCSRSFGTCVHDALETAFTHSRNMQITSNRFPFMRSALLHTAAEAVAESEHGDADTRASGAYTVDVATAAQRLESS